MTKAGGKKLIAERVEEFEKNKAALTKRGHGETNIRTNYIDVLFESLGWNMKSHYDVVREFSQKDTSGTKKVDYAFKINGKLKFFVEAKEASVDLVNDKDAIYQAKRYAYSTNGRAPIVILTDFEEFRVFNVLKAPDYNNTDRELLKKYCFEYTQYLENWDLLWDTFSKEAVENGSLDAIRGKIDKNTKTMDVDFLEQITDWRETLAKNIALRNKELSVEELNEAVQRILDRLLFIRNLEDREIEPENTLLDKTKAHEDIYKSIIPIFRNLDNVYNGLLFKKHFSEDLIVDDKALKDIIKNMCYPVSPFQFDVIEPEILGRIYEKFLGSKIRLTESHQAKVEEKMEVRKAGGVYYTPEYIVDYIVKNTVGKKIEGLTPEEIKKIKIVDPACGSGSFLLGAYSFILDYHARWYSENKKDKAYKNDYYINKDGELKVNLEKRGDILRNNIFGVDIDKEATEVAIMSLYLKMLDDGFDKGERDLFFIKGHVLPDMTGNVKCGNSLIGTDYFEGKLDFDIEEMKEIKPFDWDKEFADIFKNGGFDCVIGNPPYLKLTVNNTSDVVIKYYEELYKSYSGGSSKNLFQLFLERTIFLSSSMFSFIVPESLLTTDSNGVIRKLLIDSFNVNSLVKFNHFVFEDATIGTTIIVGEKNGVGRTKYFLMDQNVNNTLVHEIDLPNSKESWDVSMDVVSKSIFIKILQKSKMLGDFVEMSKGMVVKNRNNILTQHPTTNSLPFLLGNCMSKYYYHYDKYAVYGELEIIGGTRDYNKQTITPRLLIRRTGSNLCATYSDKIELVESTIYILRSETLNLKYVLGLLNSKLLTYYLTKKLITNSQGFPQILMGQLEQLPIVVVNDENQSNISSLVDQMLQTQKDSHNAKSEADKKLYEQKISMIDKKIDELVYNLYGLTEEEIRIVEG
jgi:type I restriction-modification system DNA methylase subunit